ncbi:MAG TPA: ergothioneine biosynthesis protein EgtB [Burkholderiaceae bacterium]
MPRGGDTARQRSLLAAYGTIRRQTLDLTAGLSAEDCMVQSMPDASPVKWHLAHVTWFFETLLLEPLAAELGQAFRPFRPEFRTLFNSYYLGVGSPHPRPERGMLSRPGLDDVLAYRHAVDDRVGDLLSARALPPRWLDRLELGLHHEQQHQELILTDLKHHFWRNPLRPAYREAGRESGRESGRAARSASAGEGFAAFEGGRAVIGHDGESFSYDNERPRHTVWLEPFELALRPVANGDYLRFIEDGGYRRPEFWLSDGWDVVQRERWEAPLYWVREGARWAAFTLAGMRSVDPDEPLCHVSYYEADAYARWAGARLPSEQEWEHVASRAGGRGNGGNFLEAASFHPRAAAATGPGPAQLFGDVWEWTQSAYLPYPGFRPSAGAVGEYNGKFMINQMVLRGGSCATPANHIRASYRNFFPPAARWQFSGVRLARDASGPA